MKFIAKNINLIGILMLLGFTAAAGVIYFDVPITGSRSTPAPTAVNAVPATDDHAGGCCSAETKPAAPALPPGHPPINGEPAGCCASGAAAQSERANP